MEINKFDCGTEYGNTGIGSCNFNPELIRGMMLLPPTWTQALVDIDDIVTDLRALLLHADKTQRAYPVFRFTGLTDNSEATVFSKTGYGDEEPVRDGGYKFTLDHAEGSFSLHKRLRKNNANNFSVLFFDSEYKLLGTLAADGGVSGITAEYVFEEKFKPADGTNKAKYTLVVSLPKPEELNENMAAIQLDSDPEKLFQGLIDLELIEVTKVAGKATVKVQTVEGINLYNTYKTALASGSLWTAKKAGVAASISGVVADDDTSAFEVSFTGTGDYVFNLAAPAVLEAAGIGGYPVNGFEVLNTCTITMPAP